MKEINSAPYVVFFAFSYFATILLSHYCVFNAFYCVFIIKYLLLYFHCVLLCHFIALTEWRALWSTRLLPHIKRLS